MIPGSLFMNISLKSSKLQQLFKFGASKGRDPPNDITAVFRIKQ